MVQNEISDIVGTLTNISDKRQYWLVRTMGGLYYEDFVDNSFIAIGYDKIPLSDVAKANTKDNSGKIALSEKVKEYYPKEMRPNYIVKQLLDFTYNIKKGDIVLAPSVSSTLISIGQVVETPIFQGYSNSEKKNVCPFEKRKKIKWLKINLHFDKLDSELLHLKYTRRTITEIDERTASFVDRIITPIFIKTNDAHLSLQVQKNDAVHGFDFMQTWIDLFELSHDFGNQENLEIDKKEYNIKINVQSPGTVEFISYSIAGIVVLSTFVAAIIGADFDVDTKVFKFKFKSEGLIKRVTDFLNNKSDRKFKESLRQRVTDMEINPEEITKMLEQLNKNKGE